MDLNRMNIITLAYLGDSVYELYIRNFFITRLYKVENIQKEKIKYVSANGQTKILTYLSDNNILNSDELDIVKRGRNYNRNSHPKNTDIVTYKLSTGFEALIGYLYLTNKKRLEELLETIMKIKEV